MFSIKNVVRCAMIVAALAIFIPRSAAQTISCSSDDGKRHYCSTNGPGGRVRMVQQRSESACREGYSWGSDDRGVWVDHGCRADFAVDDRRGDRDHDGYHGDHGYQGNNYGNGQVISCSSDDMHRHYCPADTRGGVHLVKQNSDSSCKKGKSWGYDERGIWVDRGCRADFQVGH
jgi:hypothetical protein